MIFSNSCEILQYNPFLGDSYACSEIILALFQINYHNLVKFDLDTDYLDAFQCVGPLILEKAVSIKLKWKQYLVFQDHWRHFHVERKLSHHTVSKGNTSFLLYLERFFQIQSRAHGASFTQFSIAS
jgi:hypothetical protein